MSAAPEAGAPVGWMDFRFSTDPAHAISVLRRNSDGMFLCADPTFYTPEVLAKGVPILPEEAGEGDLGLVQFGDDVATARDEWVRFEAIKPEQRASVAWLRPHAAKAAPVVKKFPECQACTQFHVPSYAYPCNDCKDGHHQDVEAAPVVDAEPRCSKCGKTVREHPVSALWRMASPDGSTLWECAAGCPIPLAPDPALVEERKAAPAPTIAVPTPEAWWNMILRRGKEEDTAFQQAHEHGMRDTIKWLQERPAPDPRKRIEGSANTLLEEWDRLYLDELRSIDWQAMSKIMSLRPGTQISSAVLPWMQSAKRRIEDLEALLKEAENLIRTTPGANCWEAQRDHFAGQQKWLSALSKLEGRKG